MISKRLTWNILASQASAQSNDLFMFQEDKIESSKHQHNNYIRYEPFTESVSKEKDIYGNYDSYHQHGVKY